MSAGAREYQRHRNDAVTQSFGPLPYIAPSAVEVVDRPLVGGQCSLVAAPLRASDAHVWCAARSSVLAWNSIARVASAISSPAIGPMMWTPTMRSLSRTARIFCKAGRRLHGARAAAGRERKHTALVVDTGSLELLFGLSDPGNLRRRVDDRGDNVVIDVSVTPGDAIGDRNALLLAFVRQHRPAHAIPDGPHAGDPGLAGIIDPDEAPLVSATPLSDANRFVV